MIERCCAELFKGGFRPHQCHKIGRLEHMGRFYCTLHHPPSIAARRALRDKKWQEKYAKAREEFKREALAEKLLAKYSTEELEAAKGVELIL